MIRQGPYLTWKKSLPTASGLGNKTRYDTKTAIPKNDFNRHIALPSKNFNKFQTCKNAVDAQHDVSLALCGHSENIAKGVDCISYS